MTLVADRFALGEHGAAVDRATGETVRLSIVPAPPRAITQARADLCARLSALRHPLLRPLVDYGMSGRDWFEAHADIGPCRLPAAQAAGAALHLIRFLRSIGVELTAEMAMRHVRPAVADRAAPAGLLGIVIQARRCLEAVAAVLESGGPPGATAIAIVGEPDAGLRTARVQLARLARCAGYVVLDRRFDGDDDPSEPGRHVCLLEWMTASERLPAALARAAAAGARRHVWMRFCRVPPATDNVLLIQLEPMTMRDLTSAIYLDGIGPDAAAVREAAALADGRPGVLVRTLAGGERGTTASWVHETAPEYVVSRHQADGKPGTLGDGRAGVARLQRAVHAACALALRGRHNRAARVLARCVASLAARGATSEAASASCALGELLLDRAQPDRAAAAFARARGLASGGATGLRVLVGTGRAALEQARFSDAEAVFRTAALTDDSGNATIWLARTLCLRGQLDAAEAVLGDRAPALRSEIRRLTGDFAGAAQAAGVAVREAEERDDPSAICEARLAAARVQAALGDEGQVRSHLRPALSAARRARRPAARILAAVEAMACLEACGVRAPAAARARLIRAAQGLSPLAAARARRALGEPDAADALVLPAPQERDLIQRFQTLLDAVHDMPDDAAALQAVADDLHRSLDACSIVIRSARLRRPVAAAGRSWPGESALTQPVVDGGGTVFRPGVTPEAAEPVRAGGSVIGAVAARWVAGANPPPARIADLLRLAATVSAPLLRALSQAAVRAEPEGAYPDDLLGRGPAADRVREAIRRAALAPYPVLIEGESGSGKELAARAIHARSPRRARRFCAINCAALTEDLLEAELFGHARGAFTGALTERAGLFEEADQGTLFLDEAVELSGRAQAKLLRVLQEGEVRRVGENIPRRVDARIVAATNRSLEEETRAGRFRLDLRFRLDVIRIAIPPLRERPDELPWLAERIWAEAAARVGTRATLGDDVLAALARYDWPGNVRELQNVIASIAVHGPRRGRVPVALLPSRIGAQAMVNGGGIDEARLDFERRFVRAALARAGGRRSAAAAQIGVSRQGLAKIIKRLGLE